MCATVEERDRRHFIFLNAGQYSVRGKRVPTFEIALAGTCTAGKYDGPFPVPSLSAEVTD
jgi:hypothetical protein